MALRWAGLTHNFNCAGATAFARSQVIGQFRRRRRYFSCVLCFRDPIAFVFVFFEESLHGQQTIRRQPALHGA